MLRSTRTASMAVLACALSSQSALLAAQDAVIPLQRSMNPTMMRITPESKGDLVLSWDIGMITCDGEAVAAVDWIAPHPQFAAKKLLDFPVTIGFAIDATGRATDIRVLEGGYVEGKLEASFDADNKTMRVNTRGVLESLAVRDLMPSLRASRFADGTPQANCRVVYTPQYAETEEIAPSALARIGAVPGIVLNGARRDQLGGGDCNTVGWPAPLLRGYPDFRLVSARDGARKWSWVRFDIDEAGVPTNVSVIASSGHDDLDAEGMRAIRDTRVAEGPRTACVTAWWRNPGIIPAPPAPDNSDFPEHRSCEALRDWDTKPKLTYPQAYNERQIEGWAMLGFDIAADGSIGNVRVLSAQPSEEFGSAGITVLQSGRFAAGDEPLTQCIERVRFVIKKQDAAPTGDS
jgi:TonB family protein